MLEIKLILEGLGYSVEQACECAVFVMGVTPDELERVLDEVRPGVAFLVVDIGGMCRVEYVRG